MFYSWTRLRFISFILCIKPILALDGLLIQFSQKVLICSLCKWDVWWVFILMNCWKSIPGFFKEGSLFNKVTLTQKVLKVLQFIISAYLNSSWKFVRYKKVPTFQFLLLRFLPHKKLAFGILSEKVFKLRF